ncbi:class I SAM-dependent methyltransferase [Streptomyces sp. NBC_00435]|uniref:class I SAM-dependent methyltransferase n=1 Tax=Streptomyces sp. NBC_00435 TaxID=2903649 RepID=UPI002E2100E2
MLDIGSGTGRPVSHTLVEAGCEVTGIDGSSTMVELARQQVPGARFELQDVRSLQAADETFHGDDLLPSGQ